MNGKDFINRFNSLMFDSRKNLVNVYEKHTKEYTQEINSIIKDAFGGEYEEWYYPEYFRIDHTVWTSTECRCIEGVKIYNWSFDFAIEHENDKTDWTYEMLKLSFVDAKVRIVIGYVDRIRITSDKEKQIIEEQARYISEINPNDEFYVLLLNNKYNHAGNPFEPRCYRIRKTGDSIEVEEQ